ncbi:MAG: ABC transporter ATP-binding protein [Hyphomonas sp.]|nr:ABC transporter ATP-binding protein [Hyphomonas sp.]
MMGDGFDKAPLLEVHDLSIQLGQSQTPLVDNVGFSVAPGETLSIVGESGSGKSLTSLAIMGLLPSVLRPTPEGRIMWRGRGQSRDLMQLTERRMRTVRGGEIGMIFQEPMTSLNPLFTVGNQITEALALHTDLNRRERRDKAVALLEKVGIREPQERYNAYPHQLSGGMRQRAMIAMTLAGGPSLLIADEPTTALDVTIQAQILELLKGLQTDLGMSMIFVTHDLGVVAEVADTVLVMQNGRVVEKGAVADVLVRPRHLYTKTLLDAVPRIESPLRQRLGSGSPSNDLTKPLLEVRDLKKSYPLPGGKMVEALKGIDLKVMPGEVVGLVGESGSGKSTIAKLLVGLEKPTVGEIHFEGQPISYTGKQARGMRRAIQMIFQDPFAALNPRWRIDSILTEPMIVHRLYSGGGERREAALTLLDQVGLPPSVLSRFPHEFSGGQRQRLSIARALAVKPQLLIADESVSALDVTVQAQVLDLLRRLKSDLNMTLLFIAHDMAVVRNLCDQVGVMHNGQIVEYGKTEDVFVSPSATYTRTLLSAVPRIPDQVRDRPH